MGIVTGIGDKSLNKNVIVPEIDADLNDYILNKNCIINGLEVIGNTLTAGMCVLKGYRGVLENAETLNGETYIYGKFTLNFNNGIPDDFDILKTNFVPQDGTINPASINQAGIYYLLLYTYTNGAYALNPELNTPTYPAHAYEADETDLVKSGAVIESGVTTPTPLDNNAHLTEPLRVANTEYVHNQIEEEIAYDTTTISMKARLYGGSTDIDTNGRITLKRKAKYVIGEITTIPDLSGYVVSYITFELPSGFIPKYAVYIGIPYKETNVQYIEVALIQANASTPARLNSYDSNYQSAEKITFGYETN